MKRMYVRCLCSLVMFVGVAPQPAFAGSTPEILERSAKWNVGFDPESCNVTAEFGADPRKIALQMYFYGPGDFFELRLFGRAFRYREPRRSITTDFGPDVNPVTSEATLGTAGTIPMAIAGKRRLDDYQTRQDEEKDPAPLSPEQERTVTYLDVRFGGAGPWRLQTGPMDKVMQVVRLCQTDLVRSWGYDPEAMKTFKRQPEPVNISSWLLPMDYPHGLGMMGANAFVQVRLDVSETGSVTGCHLQKPMNPKEFNELTCKLLTRRARFIPALDKDGAPARSFRLQNVRWRI